MYGFRSFEDPEIPVNWTATMTGAYQGTFDTLRIEPYQEGTDIYSPIYRITGTGSIPDLGSVSVEITGYLFLTMRLVGYGTNRGHMVYGIYETIGVITERGFFSGALYPTTGRFSLRMKSDEGKLYTLSGQNVTP